MKKKQFLTEAKRKEIIADKEKVIIESFAKMFNRIKRIDENDLNEIDWDRAADKYYPNPHDNDVPKAEVSEIKNDGYDRDNYPKYEFSANYGYGTVSCLEILSKLAGWEFTSGCESKKPEIIKVCNDLDDELKDLEDSFEIIQKQNSVGGSYKGISDEDWEKYNEKIRQLYTHDLVTKIIETELDMSLKQAIEKLLDKGLIDFEEN
jgi:hypothetical protein